MAAVTVTPLTQRPTATPPVVITIVTGSSSTAQSDSASTTQSNSISASATTGTLTSSSSSYASITSTSSSSSSQASASSSPSTSSQGLSTAARTGIAFGILFFLILSVLLFYNLRRCRRTREKPSDVPESEVSQYRPPNSGEREVLPPPRLHTAYQNSPDIPSLSPTSSAAPLLSNDSHRNSYPISAQHRYSALSQATDHQHIATQDVPTLPNPHEPFSAPARSASLSSPTHLMAYASAPTSDAIVGPLTALADGSSSNSQPERRFSVLHADMTQHQKELELEHRKGSLDGPEPQDPPPKYS